MRVPLVDTVLLLQRLGELVPLGERVTLLQPLRVPEGEGRAQGEADCERLTVMDALPVGVVDCDEEGPKLLLT